jgi:SAM-dependent methyltransferase
MNNNQLAFFKDTKPNLKYENPSLFRYILNLPILLTMSLFPQSISGIIIKKSNKKAAHVYKNVTTHAALDTLYDTGKINIRKINIINELIEHLWFNLYNSKAVRNRLKLVKHLLRETITELMKTKKNIEITSLASGSARAVIEVVSEFQNKNINFIVKLLDRNSDALKISKKIVNKNNFENTKFEFINDRIRNFTGYYQESKPDIIEMVGFLDYLDENKSIKLISKINKTLNQNGVLIIANINDNHEKKFLEKALKWKMNYKSPKLFYKLLLKSGFKEKNIELIYEPFEIHGVAKMKK